MSKALQECRNEVKYFIVDITIHILELLAHKSVLKQIVKLKNERKYME